MAFAPTLIPFGNIRERQQCRRGNTRFNPLEEYNNEEYFKQY